MRGAGPAASLVLLYHRIGSPLVRSRVRGQYVLPRFFRWQLRTLMGSGYSPAGLAQVLADAELGAGHFSITFDDGYASVGRLALPVLAKRQVPATVFVVAGAVGNTSAWDEAMGDRVEPMMDAVMVREMAAAGMEVGSHGMSHARLTDLPDAALQAEVCDSKRLLEDMLGKAVGGFAYPYGAWDGRVREAVIDAGYEYAVSTRLAAIGPAMDRFAIPRINVRWNTVGWILLRKIRRAYGAGEG